MRIRISRIIFIVLAAFLALGALTFCGEKETETTTAVLETGGEAVTGKKLSAVEMLEKATQSAEERATDELLGDRTADESGKTAENKQTQTETEPQTEMQADEDAIDSETPVQNLDGNALFEDGMTTSLGLTVPNNTRGTYISLYEVADLNGPNVWQDGSWYWLDASETTPQRGDIVVYTNQWAGGSSTHVAVCVDGYAYSECDAQMKYKCVDGNYGDEPGSVKMGYWDNSPNKGWTDSFSEAPGVEIAIGVWRSQYGELLAEGAEAAYWECCNIGQMAFLEKYIPEGVYGGWCYYLICIAANKVARGEY